MKDREFYRQAFSKLQASENTVEVLEEKLMNRHKPIKRKRLILAMACVAMAIAIPMAANAATGGKLLQGVLVFLNGDETQDVKIHLSEDGTARISGTNSLEDGDVINFMDTDPNSPNYKKGGSLIVGEIPHEQSRGFHPVVGFICADGSYMVTQITEDGSKVDIDVTKQLNAGETVEFTGSYKTLTYRYSVYMEDGKPVVRNDDKGYVEEFGVVTVAEPLTPEQAEAEAREKAKAE